MLMATTPSILIYGTEIWANVLRVEKYRSGWNRCSKKVLVSHGFQTAVVVFAGVIPIDFLVEERKCVHERTANWERTARRKKKSLYETALAIR